MTIYTEALRLAKQGEKFRWQEAAAIRVASKNGGTFREYAELRDGHHEGEQKYSNWSCADEFRETFQHQYEGELSDLWDAGMTQITYYAEIGRFWKDGAEPEQCIEFLQDCVQMSGKLRGVRFLQAKIGKTKGNDETWEDRAAKLYDAAHKFFHNDTLNAPHGIKQILGIVNALMGMLEPFRKVAR